MKLHPIIQKNIFRLSMVLAFLGFIGVFYYALELEDKERALNITQLPSGAAFGKAAVSVDGQPPASPLSVQHLGTGEVAMYFSDVLAEALSFNSSNFRSVTSSVKTYFTEEGYNQYMQFITSSGFEAKLRNENLQAGAYTEEEPVEMGRGVYDGVFKWVFQVPVTVSLIPRQTANYEKNTAQPQNRDFILRAQFARVNDPQYAGAIKIELWQVFPARKKK